MKRTVILAILDGWGLGADNESNPIFKAEPKAINALKTNFPAGALQASGLAIGLPWNEEGNSEVGHMIIGTGRTIFQHYLRISSAIENGEFFKNPALIEACDHVNKNNSSLHLVGLLSSGLVHSSFSHLAALLRLAKEKKCQKVFLHLFSDGRDSAQKSFPELLDKLKQEIKKYDIGEIASIAGRYYAMDRGQNWNYTEKSYNNLTEPKNFTKDALEFAEQNYKQNIFDEYFPEIAIGEPHPIKDNDAIIFFNFREDRMRQISESFINPTFDKFTIKKLTNLKTVTMTKYHKNENFPTPVAFPNEIIENSLSQILSENGKTQLRIAETEKYAHITYFFNGLRETPFDKEFRVLIPSNKILHPEEKPEMMAQPITERALNAINEASFDFILINYANPDIIAHTGNYDATIKAVQIVDQQIDRLIKATLDQNHVLIITSDHGNAESLIDPETGQPETKHNLSPVPFYIVAKELKRTKTEKEIRAAEKSSIGILADVAPTILKIMGLPQPKEMTGQNLLDLIA
ncbi:MAG: 2,3-bisphosphoglycerate-independent phosphoglycerate mutase [bacterium]|nr:2,3-bisphosphoglycerate-independent phosphoglycerate mutase [bacterium]